MGDTMSKAEECFNHVVSKLKKAQQNGQKEIILHSGTIQEELGWKQLQRVTSGTLIKICAQFYSAGGEYSYQPISFPKFQNKPENIYGSELRICFRFPSEKDILPVLMSYPGNTALDTVTEDLQNKRILRELEMQPRGQGKIIKINN